MKKLLSLITVIAILSQFAFVVNAAGSSLLISDDFNDYQVDTDYLAAGSYPVGSDVGAAVIGNEGSGADNHLALNSQGIAGDNGFMTSIPDTSGKVTLLMDYKLEGDGTGARVYFFGTDKSQTNQWGQAGCLQLSSSLAFFSSGGTKRVTTTPLETNKCIRLALVYDTTTDTMCIYQGGKCIASALPCRVSATGAINQVKIFYSAGEGSANGQCKIRNVGIYQGLVLPEPSLVAVDDFVGYATGIDYITSTSNYKLGTDEGIATIGWDSPSVPKHLAFNTAGATDNVGFKVVDLVLSGKITLSMDYKLEGDGTGARIYMYGADTGATEWGQAGCVQLSSNPIYFGKAAAKNYLNKKFPQNVWVKVYMIYDTDTDTMDLYVGNTCIGKNLPARTSAAGSIEQISVFASAEDGAKSGQYKIRNLSIYNKEVVPQVSVVAADNFADYAEGTDYLQTANVGTILNDGDDRGNYLRFNVANSASSEGIVFDSLSLSGKVTLSMDYRLVSGSTGVRITMSGADRSQANQYGQSGQVQYNTNPIYYGAGATKNYVGKFIPSGMWIKMTMVYDTFTDTMDLYAGNTCLAKGLPARATAAGAITAVTIYVYGPNDAESGSVYDVQNIKVYDGEVVPESAMETPASRITDITDSINVINSSMSGKYVMLAGYPMVYSNNTFELINENNKLAPIYFDGYIYAPAPYVAKAMGGTYSNGTITANGVSKTFAEGTVTTVSPVAPKTVSGVLYIPVCDALADAFSASVYIDDRGLVIFGTSSTPGEDVIKSILFELRSQSAVFSNSINSEVLYTTRTFHLDDFSGEGGYYAGRGYWGTMDAAKRFMSTSVRWTYSMQDHYVTYMKGLGGNVQPTLNPNPTTLVYNSDGSVKTEVVNGTTFNVYAASATTLEGKLYVRNDGLGNWGCVNKKNADGESQLYLDLLAKAKAGINNGMYLWQFDDFLLNQGYTCACLCDDCMTGFQEHLEGRFDYIYELANTYDSNIENYVIDELGYVSNKWQFWGTYWGEAPISEFNFRDYLTYKGVDTDAEYTALNSGATNMALAYKYFAQESVNKFLTKLKSGMDEYAATKGMKLSWSHNYTDLPANYNSGIRYYDIFDGAMGETQDMYLVPGAVFANMMIGEMMGEEYVTSNMPKQGETSMQLFASAMPLTYATGHSMLIPWDTWLYGNTRYYTDLEELGGVYAFVREHPYLFDHYETPKKVGYVFDMGQQTNSYMHGFAEGLLRKGVPSKALYGGSFSASDLEGLSGVVAVNYALASADNTALSSAGITASSYTYDASTAAVYRDAEEANFTARIGGMPENIYAVLNKHNINENAPVVVHAVNYNSAAEHNVTIEINNSYLPSGALSVKAYSPMNNPQTLTATRGDSITTITIPTVDKWTVLEISGTGAESQAKFDVDGMSGIGLGSRVSFDSAQGTQSDFIINTYGEGINRYTIGDTTGSQDEGGYVYKRVDSDVFEISGSVSAGGGERGLMIREGVHSNAAFAALIYDEESGLRLETRINTNGGVAYTNLGATEPAYMKLAYDNGYVTAYTSENGNKWTKVGSIDTFFKAETVGAFASSPDGSKNTCLVSGLSIVDEGVRYKYDIVSDNLLSKRNPEFRYAPLTDAVIGFAGFYTATDNLYSGGSFENITTTDELASVVHAFGSNDRVYTLMTDGNGANGSSNYVKMSGSTWSEGNFQTPAISNLKPGNTYRATVYLKAVSGTITSARLRFKQTGDAVVATGSALTVSDSEWTKATIEYTLPADDTKKNLIIQVYDASKNEIYVDDVKLETIKSVGGNGTVVSDSPFGDGYAFEISDRSYTSEAPYYTNVAVENGKTYEASVWAKTVSGTDTLSVVAEVPAGQGTITLSTLKAGGQQITSGEWTRCYVRFKVSDSGQANGINIRFKTQGTSDIILDTVELKEVKSLDTNINAMFTQYDNRVVLDLSTKDGSAQSIRYMLVVKEKGTDGVERIAYSQHATPVITGDTTSISVPFNVADQVSEVYIWNGDNFSPLTKSFKVKATY